MLGILVLVAGFGLAAAGWALSEISATGLFMLLVLWQLDRIVDRLDVIAEQTSRGNRS